MFIALWALLLTFDGINTFDAIGISVSTMGCIGPAFGIRRDLYLCRTLGLLQIHPLPVHAPRTTGNVHPPGHAAQELLEVQEQLVNERKIKFC